ncbi:MAG: triphosphoribosyl-dephospho-CoA synthase [Bryobacteraceae bacterium]
MLAPSRSATDTDFNHGIFFPASIQVAAEQVAQIATSALWAEATLTPKPALVDRRGPGAHSDLTLRLMHRSAHSLNPTFQAIAEASWGKRPSQALREDLAEIGRTGECRMLAATDGINTHRGAIWVLGLLVAGAAMDAFCGSVDSIAKLASELARFPDRRVSSTSGTNGSRACERFGVHGARGQAYQGFPHVLKIGLPALLNSRAHGISEMHARLNALVAIMASLDDTCLLHRGGMTALTRAKRGARTVLEAGGSSTPVGWAALLGLDDDLLRCNASPGGSADLLAATLFLDSLMHCLQEFASTEYAF